MTRSRRFGRAGSPCFDPSTRSRTLIRACRQVAFSCGNRVRVPLGASGVWSPDCRTLRWTRSNPVRAAASARIIAQPLALTPGTRLGVYEITAQIGEGGMGEVYRATDTKLKRQVAIKILPPRVRARTPIAWRASSAKRKSLASLNHPHIAAIYGARRKSAGMHRARDGTRRGRRSLAADRARRDSARRGAADREADRGRARSRARAGHHPSRSETREHQSARRRHGEGARLRPRESDGARRGQRRRVDVDVADDHDARDDAGRDDSRHGGVHGRRSRRAGRPSTSARTSGRSAACCTRC